MLSNPRHERFAQELAKGVTNADAYRTVFGKDNRRYGSELGQRPDISGRVQGILDERAEAEREARERAIAAVAIDKQWVMERLVRNVDRAMQAEAVKDSKGEPTGEYRYDGSVANRALELLGKELGMFIDRSEAIVKAEISAEPLSPAERDAKWIEQHGMPVQ